MKSYSSAEVKSIRNKTELSQKMFALALGVSANNLRRWESGIGTPSKSATRLLSVIENDTSIVNRYVRVEDL